MQPRREPGGASCPPFWTGSSWSPSRKGLLEFASSKVRGLEGRELRNTRKARKWRQIGSRAGMGPVTSSVPVSGKLAAGELFFSLVAGGAPTPGEWRGGRAMYFKTQIACPLRLLVGRPHHRGPQIARPQVLPKCRPQLVKEPPLRVRPRHHLALPCPIQSHTI